MCDKETEQLLDKLESSGQALTSNTVSAAAVQKMNENILTLQQRALAEEPDSPTRKQLKEQAAALEARKANAVLMLKQQKLRENEHVKDAGEEEERGIFVDANAIVPPAQQDNGAGHDGVFVDAVSSTLGGSAEDEVSLSGGGTAGGSTTPRFSSGFSSSAESGAFCLGKVEGEGCPRFGCGQGATTGAADSPHEQQSSSRWC